MRPPRRKPPDELGTGSDRILPLYSENRHRSQSVKLSHRRQSRLQQVARANVSRPKCADAPRRFSSSQAIVGLLHYLCIEDIGWHFFPQYLSHVLSSFLLNGGDSRLRVEGC